MTPIDEAVGILRNLASQVKDVEAHCTELRADPEEGTYVSLEFLCGDIALWLQMQVEDGEIDETGHAFVTAQLESLSLPQPLGVTRLLHLTQRLQEIWPTLYADVSVRNRGEEECLIEGEWYGEIAPANADTTLFAAITVLLHELQATTVALEEALLEAEHMQEVEERVAGLLLGTEHTSPRGKRADGPGKRRRSQRQHG